jgi:hypothetical protein
LIGHHPLVGLAFFGFNHPLWQRLARDLVYHSETPSLRGQYARIIRRVLVS